MTPSGRSPKSLTPQNVAGMLLAAQGLTHPPVPPAGKDDLLSAIRMMGALQIDTIHIVARSPYLVLWSRLGDYPARWLDELLAEKAIFEYWAHAACFLPGEEYPFYRRLMLNGGHGWGDTSAWLAAHEDLVASVLDHVRANGEVRSVDFTAPRSTPGGWWNWKVEKEALEYLFNAGELMIARRENFHRVYDLRQRIKPGWDDEATPAYESVVDHLALKAVKALGAPRPGWVPDYFRLPKKDVYAALDRLTAANALVQFPVSGWDEPVYVHPDNTPLLDGVQAGRLDPTLTTLLSPFDPLIWDRSRARALFGFDYSIECYLPASKRRYGYFTLPVLHRGALVGRLDPKAHRKEKVFEIKALYLEPGVRLDDELLADLAGAVRSCAAWHAAPDVILGTCQPSKIHRPLKKLLSQA